MNILKNIACEWLPPVLVHWMRKVRGGRIYFEGDFATWKEACAQCTGYDAKEILDKVLTATLKVKRGEAAFERDSVLFDKVDYVWPVLAGLMWVAAGCGGKLNVLDFGGALGSSYFQNLRFLRSLSDVRWNVVEQPHFVDAGLKYIQDDRLRFYKTIDECIADNQLNVILLSSVLQYLEKPYDTLAGLNRLGVKHIIVDRTPFVDGEKDLLAIQKVPESIFSATLPVWLFSEVNFNCAMHESGYVTVARTTCLDEDDGRFKFRGFLYSRGAL